MNQQYFYVSAIVNNTTITMIMMMMMMMPFVLINSIYSQCHNSLWIWRFGFQNPGAQNILYIFRLYAPALGSSKPRVEWAPGSFPEVKRPKHGAGHQHQHSAGIQNEGSHNSSAQCRKTTTCIMARQRLSRFMVQNENWNVYRHIIWCEHAVLCSSLCSAVQYRRLDNYKTRFYVCNMNC